MLPIKMYEAMACARPLVLAMEGEACRLAAQESEAAIYVKPENASMLVSALLYLYEHPQEAALMGERGRAIVTARFDYDELTATLNTRIASLLRKKM
jgi:glycosyltransferase involved in cell wall biosynthesis